jgi:hypothetical protein
MSDDFFANLEDDADFDRGTSVAREIERPTFPCQSCLGTGKYRGARVHQDKSQCFACDGRGFFYTSAAGRYKARARYAEKKASNIADTISAFKEENPGLYEFLGNATWSAFLSDMKRQLDSGKDLTERQLIAVRNSKAKQDERDAARIDNAPVVELSTIHAMFDKARESGLKKLAYRAEGLVLTPAPSTGRNAGSIYVKTKSGDYLGRVTGDKFFAISTAPASIAEALETIARNPAEAATAYGKRTGECSCCGRTLTDPESISAGIGPICATKWGF